MTVNSDASQPNPVKLGLMWFSIRMFIMVARMTILFGCYLFPNL